MSIQTQLHTTTAIMLKVSLSWKLSLALMEIAHRGKEMPNPISTPSGKQMLSGHSSDDPKQSLPHTSVAASSCVRTLALPLENRVPHKFTLALPSVDRTPLMLSPLSQNSKVNKAVTHPSSLITQDECVHCQSMLRTRRPMRLLVSPSQMINEQTVLLRHRECDTMKQERRSLSSDQMQAMQRSWSSMLLRQKACDTTTQELFTYAPICN